MNLLRRVAAGLSTKRTFRAQPGLRIYAVGDVHGRLDLLDELLGLIEDDIIARPAERVLLLFLGDLIDRGPASAGVIERLSTLDGFPAQTMFLMGNHEEVLLRTLDGDGDLGQDWLGFGGAACVESYGIDPASMQNADGSILTMALAAAIPPRHVGFLRGFGDSFRSGDYVFVHAGIRPGVPLDEQVPRDLRWIREPFLRDGKDHGFLVVHGHTISDGVEERSNRIGIDTGAYETGVLTALALEDDQRWYLATAPGAGAPCG